MLHMPFQPFLTHAFSSLKRNFPIENVTHCIFTLVVKNNLGLVHLALKMHAFSACCNSA